MQYNIDVESIFNVKKLTASKISRMNFLPVISIPLISASSLLLVVVVVAA
jgi:hypothetical protein